MGLRRSLLGAPSDREVIQALRDGATILDIRTTEEFATGHLNGVLHVPLQELLTELPRIPRDKPVVTCNADDAMSATAAEMLVAHGFVAFDGGGQDHLARLLDEARVDPTDRLEQHPGQAG